MEKEFNCYQEAAKPAADARLGAEGTEAQVRPGGGADPRVLGGCPIPRANSRGLGCPPPTQLDDFVSAHTDYNEEEEEQKYFRRKRLGVVKNVVAASLALTLTYGVYLGMALLLLGHQCSEAGSRARG